jgi:hypothetical protein
MDLFGRILPILLATIWIGIAEFIRNELLVKSYWTTHYEKPGLSFPSEPSGYWMRLSR